VLELQLELSLSYEHSVLNRNLPAGITAIAVLTAIALIAALLHLLSAAISAAIAQCNIRQNVVE
jgi:hypothetical protein